MLELVVTASIAQALKILNANHTVITVRPLEGNENTEIVGGNRALEKWWFKSINNKNAVAT